jgi:tol-pal system protein YbgF
MGGFRKILKTGGLVLLVGPLSLQALAQDYVDVEAERAAKSAGSQQQPVDPYRVKPAQAYPATSFGVSTETTGSTTAAAAPVTQDQNIGNLLYQLQLLQQEVMMLNGKVEEQAHELRRIKSQYQERYVDLDRRISDLGGSGASAPAAGAAVAGSAAAATTTTPAISASSTTAEQLGEGEAYRAAYALVRGQQWDEAITAFNKFLQDYPGGRYTPNALYWLGELYLVTDPQQLEPARQSFMMLLSQYPDNSKVPDALYKLGKVHYQKGNPAKGREYLDRVINEYGSTNSSAVRLAQDFINNNY